MYLIFDTETTGLPRNFSAPLDDFDNWPRCVQLAWQVRSAEGALLSSGDFIIRPDGFTIPFNAEKVHGISTEKARRDGVPLATAIEAFEKDLQESRYVIGHNLDFDLNIMGSEYLRAGRSNPFEEKLKIDTITDSTDYCKIPGGRGKYKWPTLDELHRKLFQTGFEAAHNAAADVDATARCFLELVRLQVIRPAQMADHVDSGTPIHERVDPEHYMDEIRRLRLKDPVREKREKKDEIDLPPEAVSAPLPDSTFVHLHCHSRYSVLQGTASVKDLVRKAKEDGMPAVALTDPGNMYGVFKFVQAAHEEGIKPIVGCECYFVEDRHQKKFTRENRDRRYRQIFLAKNMEGYRNLSELCSIGFTEGYYYKYPRIDRELVERYREGLVVTTGSLGGEVPDLILNHGEEQAEEAFCWWHNLFGDDLYVELNRHGLEEEERVNEILLRFAEKYGVKPIVANDVFYLDKQDAEAHDALLCIDNGELISTPVGRGREMRFGFPNSEFYFKTQEEMKRLFADRPDAIRNTMEIVEKVEPIELERDVILPNFKLPEPFENEDEYLAHLTLEGARERYGKLTEEVRGRIDHELKTIGEMGFSGYFLIVQDFIAAARKMEVYVGPGRGSAAGSVVAYCTGITNIDPLRYDLLFERFLNPERVSMPDIDIDFDDDGRQKVIDYLVEMYGKS
ncbi:MAG: DNA polymerase III subunit alpha, partial [Balneolaceae bacterium]